MPNNSKITSQESKQKNLKLTWLIRFVVVIIAVASGGCLVEESNNVTLIEATIGSLLIALFFAETIAIISHFMKKPAFMLTAYLLSQVVNLSQKKIN